MRNAWNITAMQCNITMPAIQLPMCPGLICWSAWDTTAQVPGIQLLKCLDKTHEISRKQLLKYSLYDCGNALDTTVEVPGIQMALGKAQDKTEELNWIQHPGGKGVDVFVNTWNNGPTLPHIPLADYHWPHNYIISDIFIFRSHIFERWHVGNCLINTKKCLNHAVYSITYQVIQNEVKVCKL